MSDNEETQCIFCAFFISESQKTHKETNTVEKRYKTFHKLEGYLHKPRVIGLCFGGDPANNKSEHCSIGSSFWATREKIYCLDFTDSAIPREVALDLREARSANKLALESNNLALTANKLAESSNKLAERADKRSEDSNFLAESANNLAISTASKQARSSRFDRTIVIAATIIAAIAANDELSKAIAYMFGLLKSSLTYLNFCL